MISQSEAPAPEEVVVSKHQRYSASHKSSLYSSTGEIGLKGGKRVNVTPKKRITKKKNV